VDEHRHLAGLQPEGVGSVGIEDLRDPLELDEVVAGAHRAELPGTARASADGDGSRVGARQASLRLGAIEVILPADAPRDEGPRPGGQHRRQLVVTEHEPAVPAGACRDGP
jgi:hypothetical protein